MKHNLERERRRVTDHILISSTKKKKKRKGKRCNSPARRFRLTEAAAAEQYSRMDAADASLHSILISHLSCVTQLCIYMEIQLVAI